MKQGVITEVRCAIRVLAMLCALVVGSVHAVADGIVDGRIGEAYGSTRAMDAGNDVTGDAECAGSAGRGNLMDFFAMSVPGPTGSTNDPWYFSWTVDSSFSLTDTTGDFFGIAASNRVNYLIGIEVNCDGAPRLEMWQDGQAWEREFAWNVDYFIAMFATGTNTMEAQLWRNDGGNNRSLVVGGIAVTSQVVGFRRQLEFALPAAAPVPEVLRNNSSLCLYLLSVQDVEGSGTVLDGVGLLNHNINCQGPAFDLSSLGAVFINTDANGKIGGRPTDPGVNHRQSLSYPDRSTIASVAGQSCEPPFGISIDGQVDSAYTLLTEATYAAPYAGGAINQSDFVGESSARTYTYMTNTIVLPGGQHGDIANLYTYADTNYLYVMVTGPTALGWELEPDLFNLFVAIDVPGKISNTDTGSTGDLAPAAANAPASRLVNFKGWDPDYVVELVWRGLNAGVDTPGNLYAANGSNGWNTTGTFLYQNIPNTAASPVGLYYSRTFPQYEFAIPWSALGRSAPPLASEVIRLGAYTTGDENVENAGESRWDIADQSPGIGQGCSGEGCHERVGDDAFDDDALTSTGLGDRTPFVGRTYGAPGYAPATDNSTNDVDTIEEYFAFRVNVANCDSARASVGDFVWLDINVNGIQELNEAGLSGVPLTLYASNGTAIASTTSLVNGAYAFTNLAPGSYYIRVHIQPGTLLSPQYQGSDPELDSNFSPFSGLSEIFTLMSGETNGTIDAGIYDVPTLAQIDGVNGVLEGGFPVLTWVTSLEYGTVGWFIEREAASGEWVRVSGPLPSAGDDLSGGRYAWPDENALPGGTYRYRIVEVEARGGWRPSDIHTITYPKAVRQKNSTSDRTYRMEALPLAQPEVPFQTAVTRAAVTGTTADAVKVVVRESGIHVVSVSDLADVLGVSASDVAAHSIRADHLGLEIPVLREGSNVFFYARSYASMYTDHNVYRFTINDAAPLPVQQVTSASGQPVTEFTDTLHVERQLLLTASIFTDAADDLWLWRRLNSGIPSSASYAAQLIMSNVVQGTGGELTVRLKGGSQSSGNGMHGVRVELNGQVLGAATFFGLDRHDLRMNVPAGAWHDGSNQLRIVMEPPTGVVNDIVYFDSFSATYRRALIAVSNRLEFATTSGPVRVGGFSHPAIKLWDVSDPRNPIQLTGYGTTAESGAWAIDFVATRAGRYVASAAELVPVQLAAWLTHDVKDNTHRVDYLVIYGPGLRDGAEQLAANRTSKGLRTKIVPVESVFDAFSHGIRDGRAIKTMLGYAYRQWETGPRYVVLAGDGSLDYQNRLGYHDCLVPAPPEGGPYGVYASDHAIGDINDDGILEVAVGRIPVTSPAQFSAYITKLEAFEAGGSWRDAVLVATDNPDGGGDYLADGDVLAAKVINRTVNRADIGVIGVEAAEAELQNGLSQGHELTAYIGHGTMLKLAEEGILTTNDVPNLNNTDKPGVLMALGCLMGVHGQPGMISIGEKLVISTNGSSATIASATLVNNRDGNEFGQLVVDEIYEAGTDRLGDAWVNAKNDLADSAAYQVAKSYQLLGDPSLAMGNAHAPRGGPVVLPTRPAYAEWVSWTFAPVWMDQELAVDPRADHDGDGLTNWDEYVAGTDPLDEHSDVVVVTVNPVSGGALSLSWPSVPGRLYRIERSSSTDGHYVTIADDLTASAPLNTWLDTTSNAPVSFYRVLVK